MASKLKSGPVTILENYEVPEELFKEEIKEAKAKRIPKYYLTNADLLPAVLDAKKHGKMTDKLARMLMLLTEKYSLKSNWAGYSFREDMVSAALINLCQNALKFDPAKSSNPFAYFTSAIRNSFLQFMIDEKKQRYIRDTLLVEAGQEASYSYMESRKGTSDEVDYFAGTNSGEQVKIPDSNPFKKKVDEAKAKKSKRQELKEKKEKQVKALLTF